MSLLDAETRERQRRARAVLAEIKAPARKAAKIHRAEQRQASKAARKASPMQGQRQPREEEPNYLAWIRGLPCIGCVQDQTPSRSMRSEAAHVRFGDSRAGWSSTGMSEKPHDRRTLPLCVGHHRQGPKAQHGARERLWWEARDIYPPALCAALNATYDAGADGAEVIRSFVAESAARSSGAKDGAEDRRSDCEVNPRIPEVLKDTP